MLTITPTQHLTHTHPNTQTLSQWLTQCQINHPDDTRTLLTDFQSLTCWQQITQQDLSIAKTARAAWRLLQYWQLTTNDLKSYSDEHIQALIQWSEHFKRDCLNQGWIDPAQLYDIAIDYLTNYPNTLGPCIRFEGFDQLTYPLERLVNALKPHTEVRFTLAQTDVKSVRRMGLPDTSSEIHAMLRWAKQQLEYHPNLQIACIVPQLAQCADAIRRHASQVFNTQTPPIHISTGQRLADYPLVADALNALCLATHTAIPYETLSTFLRSVFFRGGIEHYTQRNLIEITLREQGVPTFTLNQFSALSGTTSSLLHTSLDQFRHTLRSCSKNMLPSGWSTLFSDLLDALGWPGDRTPNLLEAQTIERFKQLIEHLAECDNLVGTITYPHALALLKRCAMQTTFQPEPTQNVLSIMGTLEAAGSTFDQLWLLGFHDTQWPASQTLNPFLPASIQKYYERPDTSIPITQRLLHSATHITVSYSLSSDSRLLRPSPLITHLPEISLEALNLHPYKTHAQGLFEHHQNKPTPASTTIGTPLPSAHSISGTAGLLKSQALCPFQAYARYRLNAHGLPTRRFGLSAAERGILVHRVLAEFWERTQSHQQLIKLSDHERTQRLQYSINRALKELRRTKPLLLTPAFIKLESKRLEQLLSLWIQQEIQRPTFNVIDIEAWHTTQLANIPFHLRIDRIDQLDDQSILVIDYKTGHITPQHWLSERLLEPQLPLYAVTLSKAHAIAAVQLKPHNIKIKGLADRPLLAGIKKQADWQHTLNQWHASLHTLAKEFHSGHAAVAPHSPTVCTYCDLHTLCRIQEGCL